jgi:hypothetical protein
MKMCFHSIFGLQEAVSAITEAMNEDDWKSGRACGLRVHWLHVKGC